MICDSIVPLEAELSQADIFNEYQVKACLVLFHKMCPGNVLLVLFIPIALFLIESLKLGTRSPTYVLRI